MEEYIKNKRQKMVNHLIKDLIKPNEELDKLEDEEFFNMFTSNEKCEHCLEPCCLRNPCCYVPDDFWSMDKDYLEHILELDLLCIDYYYNYSYDLKCYSIRPRGYADSYKYAEYNQCIFYKDDRCLLDKYERPIQPLLFISSMSGCFPLFPIIRIVDDYKPYQDVLKELYKKYGVYNMKDKEIPLNKEEQVKTLVKRIIEKL